MRYQCRVWHISVDVYSDSPAISLSDIRGTAVRRRGLAAQRHRTQAQFRDQRYCQRLLPEALAVAMYLR